METVILDYILNFDMSRIIPKSNLYQGVRFCRRNARALYNKALEAFRKECFHASYLLGFAAMEEIGKALVILNHWDDDHISFNKYKSEMCNHKHKITLAMKLIDENILEVFNIIPREFAEIVPDDERRDLLVNTRTGSIYIDYDFLANDWEKPLKQMDELAMSVIRHTGDALSMFGNELKHRGVKIQY